MHPNDVVFVAAKRTPFGTFGGSLKSLSATDLGVHAANAAFKQCGLDPALVDEVIFGNVMQTAADAIYLARHIGLKTNVPQEKPALVVNRLCGSGFEAIIQAANKIKLGEAHCVLAGGSESMSQAPHVIRGARWGLPLGKAPMEDSLWESLTDTYTGLPMALTAENLAEQYDITQDAVDNFSVQSQRYYAKALHESRYQAEICSVTIPHKKGDKVVSMDEHPRPQTTKEGLSKLPSVFKRDGVIHAGAASGICDGAAALIMCSYEFSKSHNLQVLGKYTESTTVGCDPSIMGIGPAPAIERLMGKTGMNLEEVGLVEINEAFAPQVIAVARNLGLDAEKINLEGGAIAMGHPLAASGARIITHLLYALRQRGKQWGLGSACIGGGQGTAVLVESVEN